MRVRDLLTMIMTFALCCANFAGAQEEKTGTFSVKPEIIKSGYDRIVCWSQTSGGYIEGYGGIVTSQKNAIVRSDDYTMIHYCVSKDHGKTWSDFVPVKTFERQKDTAGWEYVPADGSYRWNKATQTMLFMGSRIWFHGEKNWRDTVDRTAMEKDPKGYVTTNTWYSTYNTKTEAFEPIKYLQVPKDSQAVSGWFGCAQCWELPDGSFLIPVQCHDTENKACHQVVVLHCSFNGKELVYLNEGPPLKLKQPRGFCEPQLVQYKGKFYLSLRNDIRGYIAVSDDGLNFSTPKPWRWKETGEEIGNYNTQQHWVRVGDMLLLVYTRRGANNDNIIRNRAPLFISEFCPETMTLVKSTEAIAVPNRGAPLGNFSIAHVSDNESWIVVAEDMQSPRFPAPDQYLDCEKQGSNNAIWISRIQTNKE